MANYCVTMQLWRVVNRSNQHLGSFRRNALTRVHSVPDAGTLPATILSSNQHITYPSHSPQSGNTYPSFSLVVRSFGHYTVKVISFPSAKR